MRKLLLATGKPIQVMKKVSKNSKGSQLCKSPNFLLQLVKINAVYQGDWANIEIQFKYEKIKFHDLFYRSMEIVFQKIQKWDI